MHEAECTRRHVEEAEVEEASLPRCNAPVFVLTCSLSAAIRRFPTPVCFACLLCREVVWSMGLQYLCGGNILLCCRRVFVLRSCICPYWNMMPFHVSSVLLDMGLVCHLFYDFCE